MFSKKQSLNLISKKGGYVLIGKKSAGSKPFSVKEIVREAYNKSPLER